MRPISLTIEGLTSFRTVQEVDFSELDLFVITGPTGSGKTTILDAITFALYGRMARVDQHSRRELISHGSAAARVQLDFEVDGVRYRVARRMPKQTGAQRGSLELLDGDTSKQLLETAKIRELNERVEKIIGLNFETFTRAVLLPQGKFADFLSGEVGERRKILVQLLDLGRYERVAQIARQRAATIDARLSERRQLLETNYSDATPERLKGAKASAKTAQKRLETVQTTAKAARDLHRQATATANEVRSIESIIGPLSEAREALAELAAGWPALETARKDAKATLANATSAKQAADKLAAKATTRLKETILQVGDAAALAKLEQAAESLAAEQGSLVSLAAELRTIESDIQTAGNSIKDADRGLQTGKAKAAAARVDFEKATEEEQRAGQLLKVCELSAQGDGLAAAAVEVQTVADGTSRHLAEAETTQSHLNDEHLAVVLRQGLAVGDPCPVCQAPITAIPSKSPDVDALLETARSIASAARADDKKAQQALSEARADLRSCQRSLKDAKESLGDVAIVSVTKAKADHLNATKDLAAATAHVTATETAERVAATSHSEAVQARALLNEKKTGCKTRVAEAKARAGKAAKTLTDSLGAKLVGSAADEIKRRRRHLQVAEEAVTNTREAASAAQEVSTSAARSSGEVDVLIASFAAELAAATAQARTHCTALSRGLPQPQEGLPGKTAEHGPALKLWQTACDEHLAAARTHLAGLEKLGATIVAGMKDLLNEGDLESSDSPEEMLETLDAAVTEASHNHGVAKTEVETVTSRIAERTVLEESIGEDRDQHDLHHRLGGDLSQNRFMQWLIDESLRMLAVQASVELRSISNDRYSLDTIRGEFEVIDHANADERRSVATLSGGETFLASLSLALALSVGLRELAGVDASRLDAMFIDEGFGALDEETLGVVVDALERLQEGDRMVGVISHVSTLATRITSGLVVESFGSSSRISMR